MACRGGLVRPPPLIPLLHPAAIVNYEAPIVGVTATIALSKRTTLPKSVRFHCCAEVADCRWVLRDGQISRRWFGGSHALRG